MGTGEAAGSGDDIGVGAAGEGTEEEDTCSCVKGLMMTELAEGVGDDNIAGDAAREAALTVTMGEAAGGGEAVGAMGEGIREE